MGLSFYANGLLANRIHQPPSAVPISCPSRAEQGGAGRALLTQHHQEHVPFSALLLAGRELLLLKEMLHFHWVSFFRKMNHSCLLPLKPASLIILPLIMFFFAEMFQQLLSLCCSHTMGDGISPMPVSGLQGILRERDAGSSVPTRWIRLVTNPVPRLQSSQELGICFPFA